MSGELEPGKKTFIERGGIEFELPEQTTVEWAEFQGARCLDLYTPQMGGRYYVAGVEAGQ